MLCLTQDNYIVQRMFSEHKVPDNFVMDYLFKVYMGTVKAMADQDEEFLGEYLEKSFATKLGQRIKTLKEKGYRLSVVEDVIGRNGQPIPKKVEVLDSVFIKGLFMDRSKNMSEDQYHIFNDSDNLVVLVP